MQGIVLTSCPSVDHLLSTIRGAHIPLLKVITSWGAHWDAGTRMQLGSVMPDLLVRTTAGDGTRGDPILLPDTVLSELKPWYDARHTISFELGNEPNGYNASDDAAWNFRYWFLESLNACRETYPMARIVAPGLLEERQSEWWAICQDAFELADMIGYHAYAHYDFTSGDTGQIQRALSQLATFFPNHVWALTECGIHDPATAPSVKAQRYGALHAQLPSQVACTCWYSYCSAPQDADQAAYALPDAALSYLYAGGTL